MADREQNSVTSELLKPNSGNILYNLGENLEALTSDTSRGVLAPLTEPIAEKEDSEKK
ncbi:hypothetical protein AB0L82_41145 [Nocardia sp. NPDC052001]|uniref:hypothetical protein n=1 Tax=Nocardia sp. NPDC052001 TaxID=3154853 RepID=UPI0034359CF7